MGSGHAGPRRRTCHQPPTSMLLAAAFAIPLLLCLPNSHAEACSSGLPGLKTNAVCKQVVLVILKYYLEQQLLSPDTSVVDPRSVRDSTGMRPHQVCRLGCAHACASCAECSFHGTSSWVRLPAALAGLPGAAGRHLCLPTKQRPWALLTAPAMFLMGPLKAPQDHCRCACALCILC